MIKAIISGATGLVGKAVVKYLVNQNVEVLCLGRRRLNKQEINHIFGTDSIHYIPIKMEEILFLPEEIIKTKWIPGDSCVFYNFAWGGKDKLTNGEFNEQFRNAIHSSNAVLSAKKIGCKKFINVGTIEETFAELFLSNSNSSYYSSQKNYAVSKLASRDMCKIVSYLEKIDYVHTRLSAPISPDLSSGGYISSVLAKIRRGEKYDKPQNSNLFDIISTDDAAKAYYLIGHKGKNKADYFIGTSEPQTLSEYFEYYEKYISGLTNADIMKKSFTEKNIDIFNIADLLSDTGFKLEYKFPELIKAIF